MTDEPLDDLPYIELFYQWMNRAGYSLMKTTNSTTVKGETGSRSGAQPKASTERVRISGRRPALDRLTEKVSSGRAEGRLKTSPRVASTARGLLTFPNFQRSAMIHLCAIVAFS